MYRLLNSPQQLLAVLDGIADAITVQDTTGKLVYANTAAARTLGYPSPEALENTANSLITQPFELLDEHGQPLPLNQLPGQRALQGIESPNQTLRLRIIATGEEHWAVVKARPIFDENGEVILAVSIFQDITQLKLTEISLEEQREQFRVTLFSIGDAVIATDMYCWITFMNPVAEQLTGHQSQDALGKPIEEVFFIINEQTRERVENPVQKALQIGETVGLANHSLLISRSGAEIPIEDSSAPIRTRTGELVGAVLVFHDVTARRKAEAELRVREARFRTMADHAPVMIWMSGVDKQYHYFNKPWLEFRGRSLEQETGSGWTEGIHPDDHIHRFETYSSAFDARQPYTMEYRLRNHNGEYCWILDNGVPLFAADGTFEGYIGSCVDITERKENEQRTILLQEITAALANAVTVNQVANIMVGKAIKALGGHVASVTLLSDDGQFLETVNTTGLPHPQSDGHSRVPLAAVIPVTDAVRFQQPVWIESPEEYAACYPEVYRASQGVTNATVSLPLIVQGRVIGGFGVSFSEARKMDDDDRAFMIALAQQCAQALERVRLYEEAKNLAAVNERQRLARDLHDAVSQTLFSANIIAESLPRLWTQNPDKTLQLLEQIHLLNRGAMAEMRTLLVELRPEALINTRLEILLSQLVDAAKVRKPMEITQKVELQNRQPLPPEVHVAFYRIAQEALTNIIKHANATETIVELKAQRQRVECVITDNGEGFNVKQISRGIGMISMRERAESIHARLSIVSRKGKGTRVSLVWQRPQIEA